MHLSPRDPNFPHSAILHAIVESVILLLVPILTSIFTSVPLHLAGRPKT